MHAPCFPMQPLAQQKRSLSLHEYQSVELLNSVSAAFGQSVARTLILPSWLVVRHRNPQGCSGLFGQRGRERG